MKKDATTVRFCKKCARTISIKEFYNSNNAEKYPDGKLDLCKRCLTMHVDNWDSSTYLWILKECDVPYVPEEWTKILQKYAVDPSKVTGTTIVGRYLAKMKLKQFVNYRWSDSDFLQSLFDKKMEDAMQHQGYSAAEIETQKQLRSLDLDAVTAPEGAFDSLEQENITRRNNQIADLSNYDDYFARQNGQGPVEEDELVKDLTEEDKKYLRIKWGKAYKPDEWVRLEQLYQEMQQSYDIQGAGHEDILKMVCKTSLKSNQLLDIGDIEGASRTIRMYDALMKSGSFTAAQNKVEQGDVIDSIGEIIEMCEKQGYVEKFYIEQPNDKVDLTIQDMQRYTKDLIEKETNLSEMIEAAIRQNVREDQAAKENDEEEIVDDKFDVIDLDEIEKALQDKDFTDFNDEIENDNLLTEEAILQITERRDAHGPV